MRWLRHLGVSFKRASLGKRSTSIMSNWKNSSITFATMPSIWRITWRMSWGRPLIWKERHLMVSCSECPRTTRKSASRGKHSWPTLLGEVNCDPMKKYNSVVSPSKILTQQGLKLRDLRTRTQMISSGASQEILKSNWCRNRTWYQREVKESTISQCLKRSQCAKRARTPRLLELNGSKKRPVKRKLMRIS